MRYYFLSILALLALNGCSSQNGPAPLVVLDSQKYPEVEDKQTTYTVQSGDTLYAIAWFTGNDYQDIAMWNALKAPYSIYPGQILNLQPRKMVSKNRHSVNKSTGPTSKENTKLSIDQRDSEAYCECESDVNNSKGIDSKPKLNGFPKRVEQWIWPAIGQIKLTNTNTGTGTSGLDVFAKQGSEIKAAASGKVVYAGSALRGYGNLIIIKHTDSLLSAYSHNDQILVKERDWVKAGQQIAKMGSTGTNQVKLHFEIRYRGKAVEPTKYLPNQQ